MLRTRRRHKRPSQRTTTTSSRALFTRHSRSLAPHSHGQRPCRELHGCPSRRHRRRHAWGCPSLWLRSHRRRYRTLRRCRLCVHCRRRRGCPPLRFGGQVRPPRTNGPSRLRGRTTAAAAAAAAATVLRSRATRSRPRSRPRSRRRRRRCSTEAGARVSCTRCAAGTSGKSRRRAWTHARLRRGSGLACARAGGGCVRWRRR